MWCEKLYNRRVFQGKPVNCFSLYSRLNSANSISSPVSAEVFQEFLSEIQGVEVFITTENFDDLFQLCEEFRFEKHRSRLLKFHETLAKNAFVDSEAIIPLRF
jgi:NAD-dependent SIR2 family protein deacetylase